MNIPMPTSAEIELTLRQIRNGEKTEWKQCARDASFVVSCSVAWVERNCIGITMEVVSTRVGNHPPSDLSATPDVDVNVDDL